MSHGLLDILRYFLLALLWLFMVYALRSVFSEGRRHRVERRALSGPPAGAAVVEDGARRASLRLRVVAPDRLKGQTIDVGHEITLGRSAGCAVSLEGDSYASTLHARVFPRSGEVWIEDLGSTNGTYLNEEPLSGPQPLHPGDRIRIGDCEFSYLQ